MGEGDRGELARRPIAGSARLTPDEVANRGFASAFRGISETAVRTFLRRVADDIAHARDRERELTERVEALEAQLHLPVSLSEQQLLDALGEETARVLRSAQEAAEEIRRKSEARSAELVNAAQTESQGLSEAAREHHAARLQEAEQVATEIREAAEAQIESLRKEAEEFAENQKAKAQRDAETELEAARTQGREMVVEARAVRERILADLGKRRTLLQAQVEELRAGRDQLLDAYRVVRRSFVEATDALASVESRVPTEHTTPPSREQALSEEPRAEASPAAEISTPDVVVISTTPEPPVPIESGPIEPVVIEADTPTSDTVDSDAGAGRPDVDALFARLRASTAETDPAAGPAARNGNGDGATAEPPVGEHRVEPVVDLAAVEAVERGDGGEPDDAPEAPAESADPAVRISEPRAASLAPIRRSLLRQAKRAVQDEQNELLDALRKQKKRPTPETVLPPVEAQVASWSGILRTALDGAYRAGAATVDVEAAQAAPGALVTELSTAVVLPLRDRLTAAFGVSVEGLDDEAEAIDAEADLSDRLGARYREWKGQRLDGAIDDVLVAAYARGVFDAAPEGLILQWVTEPGGCCPDCDDNTLEPTARGQAFPTGQLHPPAHPGCRCMLVSADEASVATSSDLESARA